MALIVEEQSMEELRSRLDSPELEGFTLFRDRDGYKIYRQELKDGLFEYKVIGTMAKVSGQRCFEVLMDIDYRKKWDANIRAAQAIPNMDNGIYVVVRFPGMITDRDYVLRRSFEVIVDQHHHQCWSVITKTFVHPGVPSQKAIRVEDSFYALSFREVAGQTQFYLHCVDDLKGTISTSTITGLIDNQVPKFLKNFVKACNEYPQYQLQQTKGTSSAAEQVREVLNAGLDKAFAGL